MPDGNAGPPIRLRSRDRTAPRDRSRSARRARLAADSAGRVVALIVLVVGTGAAAGAAVGYPLRALDLGASDAVTLDQEALTNQIDVEDALLRAEDIPRSYDEAPQTVADAVQLIAATYCGGTVEPTDQQGAGRTRAFLDTQNHSFMLSEVVRVRRASDAGKYVREMAALFRGCADNHDRFFTVENGTSTEWKVTEPRRDEPLAEDFVSRTLTATKGGATKIVSYFQVGNVVVALQYAGPANPPKTLMRNAEREILFRIAGEQFKRTATVPGARQVPGDTTTTTIDDLVSPSPTSSPPLPTTVAPPPTFEPPTTTRAPSSSRRSSATTAPAAGESGP